MLADTARRGGVPYCLSTVAAKSPEEVGPVAGDMGWFQLYPPRDHDLMRDVLARAWDSGMKVLVLTIDIPLSSRRERQRRAGLSVHAGINRKNADRCCVFALRGRWRLRGMAKRRWQPLRSMRVPAIWRACATTL